MKKVIVNGAFATLICFGLSSFSANSNNLGGTGTNATFLQDTTAKMNKKMDKKMDKKGKKMDKMNRMDTSSMKMKKTPAQQ